MEEFNEIHGLRIADDLDDLEEMGEFQDSDYDFLEREIRWRELQRRAKPDRKNERIRLMQEVFTKATQLTPQELRALRSVPRFRRNLQLGKNWSISEDLTILTLSLSKRQLAKQLNRTPHSIRKRWSVLRQYGLQRRSMAGNHDDENN